MLAIFPKINDGTSFYRGITPMADLAKKAGFSLYTEKDTNVDWTTLELVDSVYLQRPFKPSHLQVAKLANLCGKKLWVDYDDLLLNVPSHNSASRLYSDPLIKKTITEILSRADLVTVSTEELKTSLNTLSKNIHVVPNAFNEKRFREPFTFGKNKTVLWRGSYSHQRDLIEFKDEIIEVANNNPDWDWVFVGFNPWYITEKITKAKTAYTDFLEMEDYFHLLKHLSPRLCIVPLYDDTFNRCKSNIAYIEATYAGAACLTPGWKEWAHPGMIHYSGKESFKVLLEAMITEDVGALGEAHKWASLHVQDNLTLNVINKKRITLYKEYMQ